MAVTEAKHRDSPGFSALPEGCIASVVSFTSPSDAARDSDAVWASFLPPDWHLVVSRCASSLKERYFSLCDDPVLVDGGKMTVRYLMVDSEFEVSLLFILGLLLKILPNFVSIAQWLKMMSARALVAYVNPTCFAELFAGQAQREEMYHAILRGPLSITGDTQVMAPESHAQLQVIHYFLHLLTARMARPSALGSP
ncbi:hypothetical protein NL676_027752 [Syzygium grande]|nr:hypothetical protein NL676_027752 [Syzygium grande]